MVETDHDLRNPADFLVLNKLAKAVLAVPGISKVQAVTRPQGTPMAHTTLPYMLSTQQAVPAAVHAIPERSAWTTCSNRPTCWHRPSPSCSACTRSCSNWRRPPMTWSAEPMRCSRSPNELRDHIADFEDFWRPIRNYFYWEPHCYDIPLCFSTEINLRLTRRHRRGNRQAEGNGRRPRSNRRDHAAAASPSSRRCSTIMQNMRTMMLHDAQHHVRGLRPDGRRELEPDCYGKGLRHRPERRYFLHSAGCLQERGLQRSDGHLSVPGRKGRPDAHFAEGRSRHPPMAYRGSTR